MTRKTFKVPKSIFRRAIISKQRDLRELFTPVVMLNKFANVCKKKCCIQTMSDTTQVHYVKSSTASSWNYFVKEQNKIPRNSPVIRRSLSHDSTWDSWYISTFRESKHAVTRPLWMATWAGGCAKRHSSSVREHFPLWNSRQTSTCSQRGSFPIIGTIMLGELLVCLRNWDVKSVVRLARTQVLFFFFSEQF
jgi:hypothetical protein